MSDIKCQYCPRAFPNEGALGTHLKWKHSQQPTSLLECEHCGKVFKYLSKLRYHVSRKHSEVSTAKNVPKKPDVTPFACLYCKFVCFVREELCEHYSDDHGLDMTEYRLNFPTVDAFELWKTSFSKENNSWFINTGGWPKKDGSKCLVYKCHRDGCLKPTSQNKRLLSTLGPYKVNGLCTAHIKAYVGPTGVDITYIKTHVGHDSDLSHLKLASSERDRVIAVLFGKVPMDTILDNIKDSVANNELQRHHLLTRKDLWDASMSGNNENLHSWVEAMASASSVVRFYKPRGRPDLLYPQLDDQDLFLVLASDAQIDMLKKNVTGALCIDHVCEPPNLEFNLFAIMVLDSLRQSFPVAFMLSSRSDAPALEVLFRTLRLELDASPSTKVFLSPPHDKYYEAWCAAMGPAITRAFCPWHLDQDWKGQLSTISNPEKQATTFEAIKRLQAEADFYAYDLAAAVTMYNLEQDVETRQFAEYFTKFREEPSAWVRCFWQSDGPRAHADPVHTALRRTIAKDSVPSALRALLHFARRRLASRLLASAKSALTSRLSQLRIRCTSAAALTSSEAEPDGNSWKVSDGLGGTQLVTPLRPDCDCRLRCPTCQACVHSFSCTCPDATLHWNMCLHIHLLCRLLPPAERAEILQPPLGRTVALPSQEELSDDEPAPPKPKYRRVPLRKRTQKSSEQLPVSAADPKQSLPVVELLVPVVDPAQVTNLPISVENTLVVDSTESQIDKSPELKKLSTISIESSQASTISNPDSLLYQALIQPRDQMLHCRCSIVCVDCAVVIHSVDCGKVSPSDNCNHRNLVYLPRKGDHDYAKHPETSSDTPLIHADSEFIESNANIIHSDITIIQPHTAFITSEAALIQSDSALIQSVENGTLVSNVSQSICEVIKSDHSSNDSQETKVILSTLESPNNRQSRSEILNVEQKVTVISDEKVIHHD